MQVVGREFLPPTNQSLLTTVAKASLHSSDSKPAVS